MDEKTELLQELGKWEVEAQKRELSLRESIRIDQILAKLIYKYKWQQKNN